MAGPLTTINFLYTNIGRGHPFYLDGILEALIRTGNIMLVRDETDVFAVSKGFSRAVWQTARWLYHHGSSPGPINFIYNKLRSETDYNRSSIMLRTMGRDIRKRFLPDDRPIVVAHPTLVAILNGKRNLIYQHGELAVPRESVVTGASTVLVPTAESARPFIESGYPGSSMVTTGLCVEPPLVKQAHDAFTARKERIAGNSPLTGAFFSSGAEPRDHVDKLVLAAASAIAAGGRALVFARKGGHLEGKLTHYFRDQNIEFSELVSLGHISSDLPQTVVIKHASRREENHLTAKLFPTFDYFMAPSHERTNWALGLGLPMFTLGPCIGPFAPLNREILIEAGVAERIDSVEEAESLGQRLSRLRSLGNLSRMAQSGWGKLDIHGFDNIAHFLINNFASEKYIN